MHAASSDRKSAKQDARILSYDHTEPYTDPFRDWIVLNLPSATHETALDVREYFARIKNKISATLTDNPEDISLTHQIELNEWRNKEDTRNSRPILRAALRDAEKLIAENWDMVEALALALYKHKTLNREEIYEAIGRNPHTTYDLS